MKRSATLIALLLLSFVLLFAQSNVAPINGTVTDPQGGAVPNAQIDVVNSSTGLALKTTSNERGEWQLVGMQPGYYQVTVSAPGFTKYTVDKVLVNAGVAATVNAKLEIGSTTETVMVSGAAELVQTTSATLSSTVQTKQVTDLPYISRGGMDLLITQPGVQTTGANRNSTINGLPLSALNVTVDGINAQDNYLKNSDGFFSVIPVRQDALQEITLTTSATGADSNSGGAATVRFVTKGGTNDFHGGAFYQHRNTWLNANSYFNNINGAPRNRQIIHQGGANLGGPIKKNKLLFFTNLEIFNYPATSSLTRQVLVPAAIGGNFTYAVSGKGGNGDGTTTVNVLQLAQKAGFNAVQDPIILKTLNQINSYTANGLLQSRVVSATDYNKNNLLFSPGGMSKYWTDTSRLDYNITDKHTFSLIYTYYKLSGKGDVTNNVFNIFPGTGAVVGSDDLFVSQSGNRYQLSGSLRSSITARITNELRFGGNRALSLFRPEISSPNNFSQWRGYAPTLGFGLTGVASVTSSSRRASPVRELHDTVSMVKGSHTLSFGFDASQINSWLQTIGTSVIPTIGFGLATNDPIVTGTTNIFTTTNFPGATTTNLSDAGSLYALLTGRVSNITRSVAYDGKSYQYTPKVDDNRQYEYGFFAQDSWRVAPSLTVNLGLRFNRQLPFQNSANIYSDVSYASLWGVSGVGNLFKPGVYTGVTPTFDRYDSSYYHPPNSWNPSIGLAWQLPQMNGFLGRVFGQERGKSVLRAGYAINTIRNGAGTFVSMLGANKGVSFDTTVTANNAYASDFGPAGSVLFSQANLPVHAPPTSPAYPLAATTSDSLNGYDPNLKMGYVQSWNIGFQRELSKSMVMEVRYTGNHGVKLWRQVNINEINTFENGFQKEFAQAQANLFINRGCQGNPTVATAWNSCTSPNSNNFANNGLPGQGPIPTFTTYLTAATTTNDLTTATYLRQNRVGSAASAAATNTTNYARLMAAGYTPNYFQVNPNVSSGGSYVLTNGGSSFYDALQVEVNRRLTAGLLLQGSYVFGKSLVNGSQGDNGDYAAYTTFRNPGLDKIYNGSDIRHAIKINGLYELPLGKGRHFLATTPVLSRVLEGWELSGISRMQSGAPFQLTSGRTGLNGSETGVVLNNLTTQQLQDMVGIYKTSPANSVGQVMWLPPAIIANSQAAFEVSPRTWKDLDPSAPYIGPQLAAGQFGYRVYLRNPWQYHFDAALLKRTTIHERINTEFQVNFMNVLNNTNFFLQNQATSTSFGRTTSAYNDLTYNYDPGSRVIEMRLRVSF